jgi:methionine-rich copper-binding protein CopC
MKRMNRHLAVALAAALALGLGVTAAYAHVSVTSRSPGSGAAVKKTLKTVRITFSGQLRSGTLKVYNANGTKVSNGTGGRDPRNVKRLVTSLKSNLKAGRYTAKWTIVAADGHSQKGSWGFRLTN